MNTQFNFEVGRVLAIIKGGKYDGKMLRNASYEEIKKHKKHVEQFKNLILYDGGEFQPCPDISRERTIIYLGGSSGSGKSYLTKQFCKNYNDFYKDDEIYLFSKLPEDVSLEGIQNLNRVVLDDRLITEPIESADLENSCCIFDDIDSIRSKDIKKALGDLKTDILEVGRHDNTSAVLTSHQFCKGAETKSILLECHSIVAFPHSGMPITYVFKNYIGMNQKQLDNIKKMDSRFVMINRLAPMAVISQKEAYFLADMDGDYTPPNFNRDKDIELPKKDKGRPRIYEEITVVKETPDKMYNCKMCKSKMIWANRARHFKSKMHQKKLKEAEKK